MPMMTFDLEDGKLPVSFSINTEGAERFMDFMAECTKDRQDAADLRSALAQVTTDYGEAVDSVAHLQAELDAQRAKPVTDLAAEILALRCVAQGSTLPLKQHYASGYDQGIKDAAALAQRAPADEAQGAVAIVRVFHNTSEGDVIDLATTGEQHELLLSMDGAELFLHPAQPTAAEAQEVVGEVTIFDSVNDVEWYGAIPKHGTKLYTQPQATAEEVTAGDVADMEARKDAAYYERNQVVAALAKCFPSGVAKTNIEDWSEDWHHCVYIDLPTGQVSWHYHNSHVGLFTDLPNYAGKWDGHDTDEKYRRVAALRPPAPKASSTDKLLTIIGYAYQIAGAHDAPEHILDVLADPEAATDEQVEAMLPYVPKPDRSRQSGNAGEGVARSPYMLGVKPCDWGEQIKAGQAAAEHSKQYYICPRCDKATVDGAVHTCTPPEAERAEPDARALFEHHERASNLSRSEGGEDDYANPYVQSAWEGWQARAALQQQAGWDDAIGKGEGA